jgi:hypothetical protein
MSAPRVEQLLIQNGPIRGRELVLEQMPWYTSQSVRGKEYLDSITPAAAMLNMLGVPPSETNRVIVSTLCSEIRADVSDLTPRNLESCFKKRIMKWIPYGVLDNKTLQDTVVEVVNCIPVENITQELTVQFKIMWTEGKHKTYLRSLFNRFPLVTKQLVWLHHPNDVFYEELDTLFLEYTREASAISQMAQLSSGDRRAKIPSIERLRTYVHVGEAVVDLQKRGEYSDKLYQHTLQFIYDRFIESGNAIYGSLRTDLLTHLTVNGFPFRDPDNCRDLVKAVEKMMQFKFSTNEDNEGQIEELLSGVNNQLKDAFKVAGMREFKIQRLTNDYSASQTLSRTCKLSGKTGKRRGRAAVPVGGTLMYRNGKFHYETKVYKDHNDGEKPVDIVKVLKHAHHQNAIRINMGLDLNVKLLKDSILVYFNKLKYPKTFARLAPTSRLEDNTIIYIPTDDEILEHMQPGQGLSNHDVPLISCQKEPLWLILNDKKNGYLFSQPAVQALTDDEKAIYLAEIERPMDAGTLMDRVKERKYTKDLTAFLKDYFLIFDNCLKFWGNDQRFGTQLAKNLVGLAYRIVGRGYVNLLRKLKEYDLYRELAEVERLFSNKYDDYRSRQAEHKRMVTLAKEKLTKAGGKAIAPDPKQEVATATTPSAADPNEPAPSAPPPPPVAAPAPGPAEGQAPPAPAPGPAEEQAPPAPAEDSLSVQVMLNTQLKTLEHLRDIDRHKWFESSVGLNQLSKYSEIVTTPMSFADVETRARVGQYDTAEKFIADLNLIFDNCQKYHSSEASLFTPKNKKTFQNKARRLKNEAKTKLELFMRRAGIAAAPKPVKPKALVGLQQYSSGSQQVSVTVKLTKTKRLEKCLAYMMSAHLYDPYKIFPLNDLCRGVKVKEYFGDDEKFTYDAIKRKLSSGTYENEEGERQFTEDMSKMYGFAKRYYRKWGEDGFNYMWAQYSSDRLPAIVNEFTHSKGPFPGDDAGRKTAVEISHRNMMKLLIEVCKRDKVRPGPMKLVFSCPVSLRIFPNYTTIVGRAMDYLTMRRNLDSGQYTDPKDFLEDLHRIYDNCDKFNAGSVPIMKIVEKERAFVSQKSSEYFRSSGARHGKPSAKGAKPKSRSMSRGRGRPSASRGRGSRSSSRPRDEKATKKLLRNARGIVDVVMIFSSPPVRRALHAFVSELFRRSLFAKKATNAPAESTTGNDPGIDALEMSLMAGLHEEPGESMDVDGERPELADDFATKCVLPFQNNNLNRLSRWLCLGSCNKPELLHLDTMRYAHRSPNPFFCKSSLRLQDGTVREIDSYDFLLRNILPEIGKSFLDSYVSQRVAIGNGEDGGLSFTKWDSLLSESNDVRSDELPTEEDVAKQSGLLDVVREQFMSSVVHSVGAYDTPFLKAGLKSIVKTVDTERIITSFYRFPQALLGALVSITDNSGTADELSVDSSEKNLEIIRILSNNFFLPFLKNLQHEEKLEEKLKERNVSGHVFESYVLGHKTVAEFILHCWGDVRGRDEVKNLLPFVFLDSERVKRAKMLSLPAEKEPYARVYETLGNEWNASNGGANAKRRRLDD